jgi:glucosamine--fructose-6-phosphate aminotransferase (isomerizing)
MCSVVQHIQTHVVLTIDNVARTASMRRLPMTLRDEILDQPAVADRFLARAPETFGPLATTLRSRGIDHVVIAARGTSDHAAIYAQYVFGIRHGWTVALGTPSVVSIYGARPSFDGSLVIGISQSGASPDVVAVVAEARRQGAATLAITNVPGSDLATTAETTIDLGAGPEVAVAATKTYTTELLAIAALSAALAGGPDDPEALARLPDALGSVVGLEPDIIAMSAAQAGADRFLVLARGYEYPTAREWALKLKELGRVFADPYSAADFEHGPLALLEPGVPVLAVVRPGPARDGFVALLDRLRAGFDAELAIATDDPAVVPLARWPLLLPAGTPEWLGPIVSIVVGQLHALHLARARRLDPESPRNLRKVTRTT